MVNAFYELDNILKKNGKVFGDIHLICIDGVHKAEVLLKKDSVLGYFENWNYDNGYGGTEMNTKLVIVFSDGSFIYRQEYDGSEWWKYSRHTWVPGVSLDELPYGSVELVKER